MTHSALDGEAVAAAVELRAVSKAFDGAKVLHDVSLTINRGELLALLGGSGCC